MTKSPLIAACSLLLSFAQASPLLPAQTSAKSPQTPPTALMDATVAGAVIEFAQRHSVMPIPLDPPAPPNSTAQSHGVVFDKFMVGQLIARAAIAAGKPLDPAKPPAGFLQPGVVVVAFPLKCGGTPNLPRNIEWLAGAGRGQLGTPARKIGGATGAQLKTLLPGVELPPGSVAQQFSSVSFQQNPVVKISYASAACPSSSPIASLPLMTTAVTPSHPLTVLKLPAGSTLPSPTNVEAFVVMSPDGRLEGIVSRAAGLKDLVLDAMKRAGYQPNRVNGTPVSAAMLMKVTFTADGLAPKIGRGR